ncbi:MAG TPA: TetR/AcrR family transcriptional regulator [Thermodesulfobacteriota bacterium]|jgi:AcrR family transcriptional regulator|nr:TetR/AcrR family transcriptional regulator [Thermodesulfobacteriota bacterium]
MAKPVKILTSIENTAIRLFASKGIQQVTIKDIAKEAGCSEGALYRHYSGKEEMALSLYKNGLERFGALLKATLKGRGSFSERLRSAVGLFYSFFDEDPVTFKFILLSEHHFPKENKLDPGLNPHNLVFDFIREGIKRGEFKNDDTELSAAMVLGLVLQPATLTATGRLKEKMRDKTDEVAEACLRVLKAKDNHLTTETKRKNRRT